MRYFVNQNCPLFTHFSEIFRQKTAARADMLRAVALIAGG
jgi:hypothetical protein